MMEIIATCFGKTYNRLFGIVQLAKPKNILLHLLETIIISAYFV